MSVAVEDRFAGAIRAEQGNAFGRELERLRRRRGLTYDVLAERAGVSATYLRDLCHGRRGYRPSLSTLHAIAGGLGVPVDTFRLYRHHVLLEHHPEDLDRLYAEHYGNGHRSAWDRRG